MWRQRHGRGFARIEERRIPGRFSVIGAVYGQTKPRLYVGRSPAAITGRHHINLEPEGWRLEAAIAAVRRLGIVRWTGDDAQDVAQGPQGGAEVPWTRWRDLGRAWRASALAAGGSKVGRQA